jgi:hypothetical protein
VFPFLAQVEVEVEVEVGTSRERAKEGSEFWGLLCRRPPFGPDFHQHSPGSLSAAAPAARGFAPELFAGELARGPHAIGTVVGARAGPRPMRSRRFGLDLAVRYVDKTDGRKR